jgi:hypothetical protein
MTLSRVRLIALVVVLVFASFEFISCAQQSKFPFDGASAASSVSGNDHGAVVVAMDNKDIVSLSSGEAGPQYHLRVTRAYCDKRSGSSQSAGEQATYYCVPDAVTIDDAHPPSTTPNKSYLIAPYNFGMAVEYPGVLETSAKDFSLHNEHALCTNTTTYLDSASCNASAHFWVGDTDDLGGLFATAYDMPTGQSSLDPTQSFVMLASDTFGRAHQPRRHALHSSRGAG